MTEGHLVSVVIPTLNEEQSISACLDSVLAQTHRELEVLVVDGGSTDRTCELVEHYRNVDDRVRLINNPRRIQAAALNEAARAMNSDWLVRVDAHSTVPPDYVGRAYQHLQSGDWGGVGGRKDGVGYTNEGRAIAVVLGSRFGVGNSTYHHGTTSQTVDHIPFGAYPRTVIERVGGWDETIPVNEDYEFDHRVREAGYQLLFDPAMAIAWEVRPTIRSFWRQYRRYGRGKAQVVRLHPASVSPRHLAAPALVLSLVLAAALLPFKPRWSLLVVTPYLLGLGLASATAVASVEVPTARRYVPVAFLAMHLGWGIGFWEGVAGASAEQRDGTR